MDPLLKGTVLQNRYRIEEILGSGGMGSVYLARGLNLQKQWAIKEMIDHFTDPQDRSRVIEQFQIEANLLANLHHPNLPRVVDYFEEGRRHYLVMDYVQGKNLKQIVEEAGPLSLQQVKDIAAQILQALLYLHSMHPPVILRDIKPANVMVTSSGQVKLIDFGIAKIFHPTEGTREFIRGVGSPGFAAPEQYGGGGTDESSDLYSVGATLYYCLSGVVPEESVKVALGGSRIQPLSSLNPQVPPALERVVGRAMEMDPKKRFKSATEMLRSLEEVQGTTSLRQESLLLIKEGDLLLCARMIEAFRSHFTRELSMKEREHPLLDLVLEGWLGSVFTVVCVEYVDILDEDAMESLLDTLRRSWRNLLGAYLLLPARIYFFPSSPRIPNPVSVRYLATQNSRFGYRSTIICPIDIENKIIYEDHVPPSLKDSNDLTDCLLNTRIALSRFPSTR